MKNAQNILFDLDGTLSDPKEGITKSIVFALEKMGHRPPPLDELVVLIGPPLRSLFKTLIRNASQEDAEQAATLYRQRYVHEGKGMTENLLYPDIPEVLATLKKSGKKLFVATSKAKDISEKIICHFGLAPFFDKIYGSEIDGTRSDKTELIAHILACESIEPANAVMIGDRKHDIIGAKQNGLLTIGALWGYGSEEELQKAGATALAKKPKDLLALFL